MDSVDIEVLRTAEGWRKQGHKTALGTIVKTWGSAPRPIGAMVAIRDDGQIVGSVSGGCVEDDLVEKVREKFAAESGKRHPGAPGTHRPAAARAPQARDGQRARHARAGTLAGRARVRRQRA